MKTSSSVVSSTFALLTAFILFFGLRAEAANRTWTPGTTDFNLNTNWTTATAPTLGDTATFLGPAGTQPTVTANISITSLTFSGATSSGYDLSSTGGAVLTLTGATAVTSQNTSGINTLSGFIELGAAGNQNFTQSTGGTLLISGNLSGTGGVASTGGGALVLAGNNSHAGGVTLAGSGNNFFFNSANALGFGTLTINGSTFGNSSGAALTIATNNNQVWNNNFVVSGASALDSLNLGTGAVSLGTTAGTSRQVTVNGVGNVFTIGGSIANGTTANSIIKAGAGTLALNGANTINGSLTVNGGVLSLGGSAGSALNISGINIAGGIFALDNTGPGNNLANRLNDSQAVNLSGGSFIYLGSDQAATNSSETIGVINLGSGTNVITVNYGGSNAADLTVASIAHAAGQNVALVNGTNLGANAGSTSVGHLFLTTAPTLVGTTAALSTGINAGVHNTVIVPYLLGEAATGSGGLGTATGVANTFLTYDASTGLRPLNVTDEFTNNSIVAGNNTRITAATNSASTTNINSLIIAGANLTVANGTTLTIDSGAVLFTSANNIASATGNQATLNFTNEAFITSNGGSNAINASLTTSNGNITHNGPGNLTISGTTTSTTGLNLYNNGAGTLVLGGANGQIHANGAITNAGVGTATTTLNGVIGAGVTGINQNSTTSLLAIGNNANLFAGPINIASGARIQYNGNASLGNASNVININNGILEGVAGNSTLSSTHGIVLNGGGTLQGTQAVAANISGTGPLTFAGSVLLSGNNTFAGGVSQPGSGRLFVSSEMNLGGNPSSTLAFVNSSGIYSVLGTELTSFGSHNVTFGGGVSGSFTFDIQDANNDFQFDRNMNVNINSQGTTGALVKTGLGTMTFTVNQTFVNSGVGLAMNGGTVVIDKALGVGIPTATNLGFGGGDLVIEGDGTTTTTFGNVRRLDGGGGALVVNNNGGSGTTTVALGTIADVNNGTTGAATGINQGGSLDIRTVNPGSGAAVVTTTSLNTNGILGAGHVTFNGTSFATNLTNTSGGVVGAYTGATAGVGNATVATTTNYELAGSGSIGANTYANTLKITTTGAGESLNLGSNAYTLNTGGLLFAGADDYTITSGTVRSASAGTNSDLIIHQGGAGVLTIDSAIANGNGASTLTKTGTGTLVLNASNLYTGSTYINDGVLSIGATSNLGSNTATLNINGGTLRSTATFSLGRLIALGGDGGRFDIADAHTLTVGNAVSGGALIMNNTDLGGSGILLLNAGNTFSGGVFLNRGTLQMGSSSALNASGLNTLSMSAGGGDSILRMNNFNATVAGLTGGSNAIIENGAAGGGTSTLTANIGATSNTFAGVIRNNNGVGAGVLAFTKEGAGTLILTGANTYTGATAVNGGTLLVNGSLADTTVTVGNTATLGGGGSIAGAVTILSGGTLSPGSSPEDLTISNNLTESTGSFFTWELISNTSDLGNRGSQYDGINVTESGVLTIESGVTSNLVFNASGSTVNFEDSGFWGVDRQWLVYDNTNAPNLISAPIFDTVTTTVDGFGNNFSATGGSFAWVELSGDVYLQYTAIPEPSTIGLIGLSLGLLALRRRRKA